ncbi:MAG: cysteine desulfurase NifS [Gemmatimonadetes bacterium]|nr:cysteine desulfurase NifS [Gemmatimonadota bacterium]
MRRIYLDHNATTPLLPEAFEAMAGVLKDRFGNPSSSHSPGREARALVDRARREVAGLIGARPSTIVFTSGGTEADHLALGGVLKEGDHVVTSSIEHHAVLDELRELERSGTIELTEVPVGSDGVVDPGAMLGALRDDTALVSLMFANNETGVVQPIDAVGAGCRSRGIPFHSDAVQAVGKLPIDVGSLPVDLLSLSAHKFGGPKGVGGLYLRRGFRLRPLRHGGEQERRLRPGTENVSGIVGMGVAARVVGEELETEAGRIRKLRDTFETELAGRLPDAHVNGAGADRVPNTTSVTIYGVDAEALLLLLDMEGIAVSAGSACTTGAAAPSHVLTAMGLDSRQAADTLRIAWGRVNDANDPPVLLRTLMSAVQSLGREQ